MSHTVVYIQSLIMCIFFLGMLLFLNFKHGKPMHFRYLAAIYGLCILSATLDIFWILTDGKEEWKLWAYFTHPVYLSCFTLISAIWFLYCEKLLPFPVWKNKLQKLLLFLPFAVIILLNVTSVFTGWMFYLDEEFKYCRGPLYYIQMIGYLYLIVCGLLSLKARRQSQLTTVRKQFGSLAHFCVFPLLFGIFSVATPPGAMPTMQFSILVSLFLVFIEGQSIQITHDSLTGLANRHSLDFVIAEQITRYKKNGERFFILMGDMNQFKVINDTYGHMEGDRILKVVANTLDSVACEYGTRASRMGGDEFAIVLKCTSLSTAVEMKNRIHQELDNAGRREDRNLSISIGIAEYHTDMTLIQLLEQADQNLYLEKHKL